MMFDRLPLSAQSLFAEYINLIKANLDYLIYGVYIQGSIALNDFDEFKSDIDYITVLNSEPTKEELSIIISIHNRLRNYDRYIVSEGQYTAIEIISGNQNSYKKIYPYYADGELKELNNGKIDATSLWILDKYGFSIYGQEGESLSIVLDFKDLISQMNYNLNIYWLGKINDNPELFLEDYWIDFGILTICRIIYTLENREITSKIKAADYLLARVDEKWKLIINEAIMVRKDIEHTFFPTKQQRAEVAVQFIKEMIQLNNKYFIILR